MLDDPAMDAMYEAIADAAKNFMYVMHETNFGDWGIAGNNVTYYNVDGTVRCECKYESAGVETVAFGVEGTTAEEVADGFAEKAEMLGHMMFAYYAEEEKPVNIHVNETGWRSEAVPEKFHFNDTPMQNAINNVSEGEH